MEWKQNQAKFHVPSIFQAKTNQRKRSDLARQEKEYMKVVRVINNDMSEYLK